MRNMHNPQRREPISKLIYDLYEKPEYYSKILEKHVDEYLRKYDNKHLQRLFDILPYKFIAICPIALCDSLLVDLGEKCSDKQLAALGFVMFGISMHDDIVDELFNDRQLVANLLFSGNIACNEGIKLLAESNQTKELSNLLSVVNENHFYQHYNIYTLWSKKPSEFDEYLDGLKHDIAFMRIGLEYALTIASKCEMSYLLNDFATNYGYSIQLLDDLREVEEDKEKGYFSFPAIEGKPYKQTIHKARRFAEKAICSLPDNWLNLRKIANNLSDVVNNYRSL